MFKMPSHPTVFIIVVEQGELGEGRDEKDFCFPLYFSTSWDGFPTVSRKTRVELELCRGWGGGRAGPAPGSWNTFQGGGGHSAPDLIKMRPSAKSSSLQSP